jgi:hypothetical protein
VVEQLQRPAAEIALIDDFAHNLPAAAALGLLTIYLGESPAEADLCLRDLHDLPEALRRAHIILQRR